MKHFFTVGQTFSEITPESASEGDFSDTGWEQERSTNWSVQDILSALRDQGAEEYQCFKGTITVYGWYSTTCYETGTEKQLCLHIEGSEKNIQRLNKIIRQKIGLV